MKKLIGILALIIMLTGCKSNEIDYYCQITGRNIGGYEVWKVVDYYEVEDKIVKLYIKNGVVLEYDLEELIVICTEMEIIE